MKKKAFFYTMLAFGLVVALVFFLAQPSPERIDSSRANPSGSARPDVSSLPPAGSPRVETLAGQPLERFTLGLFAQRLDDQVASSAERRSFEDMARRFVAAGGRRLEANVRFLSDYLAAHPASPLRTALLLEKAEIEWMHGHFSEALATLKSAWESGVEAQGTDDRRLAEAVAAELLKKLAAMGRKEEVRDLLAQVQEREIGGYLGEWAWKAKETLWFLDNQAEQNVFCGFTAANQVCVPLGQKPIFPDVHDEAEAREFIEKGLSLFELRAHSHESDGDLRILKRVNPEAELPVPSVVHWKFGHYSAVTERNDQGYRVQDSHLGYDSWVTASAFEKEASGYVLVAAATPVSTGFVEVGDDEAKTIFGRHCNHGRDPEGDDPDSKDPCDDSTGMAIYNFRMMNPGLQVMDTPVFYSTPYGPDMAFRLEYDQRSPVIEDLQLHSNFGPRWTHDYISYVILSGSGTPAASVKVVFGNGNYYDYSYSSSTASYTTKHLNRPKLAFDAAGAGGYILTYPDGRVTEFRHPNSPAPTRYYLTTQRDPQGNGLTLAYDAQLRITSISDALGQATTLSYTPAAGDGVPEDTLKIRAITDPFGRTARFRYNEAGLLASITDPVGIVSEFGYTSGHFLNQLTTPYGVTTFAWGDLPGINSEPGRYIEATDPEGDKERAEANDYALFPSGGVDPLPAPTSVTVAGQSVVFRPKTTNLHYRNTYYWDKLQSKYYPGDYSKATIYNWKASSDIVTGVPSSMKRPLQAREWYEYPGQTNSEALGNHSQPAKIVRAVENPDGGITWTMERREYDPLFGRLKRTVDPLGREMTLEYNDSGTVPGAVQGMDLTAVKVKEGGVWKVLASFSDYVAHQPQTITDAAGQVTTFTYNANGQLTSMTNALGETTTYLYYSANAPGKQRKGRLASVDGALPGSSDTTTFDYDNAGNLALLTESDGYTLSYAYDDLNRLTRTTFPDGTFEETTYQALDAVTTRDRLGRLTTRTFNSLRQLVSETDPAGRTIQYGWCKCGSMRQIIDAMGRTTTWRFDAQGRQIAKEYVDGSMIRYVYESLSGRLSRVIDEKGQVKQRSYYPDGTLKGIDYLNAEHATPSVSYTYDADHRRVSTMTDGTGVTTYFYNPVEVGVLGAADVASEHTTLTDATLTYAYDALGRRTGYALDGVGETLSFDALGRVSGAVNPLGTFSYGYDGASRRVASVQYPNGLGTAYQYHPLLQDFRLKEIVHARSGNDVAARFEYEHDAVGNITRWTQIQPDAGVNRSWLVGYDDADQMVSVSAQEPGTFTPQAAGNYAWSYDPAGNRLTETRDGQTTTTAFNPLNQIVSSTGGSGTQERTFEWDAEDRLIGIRDADGIKLAEFAYDGLSRRRIVRALDGGGIVSESAHHWEGLRLIEERAVSGGPVGQRYFGNGVQSIDSITEETVAAFLMRDHLGSPRSWFSPVSEQFETVAESFAPWGETEANGQFRPKIQRIGYTGHWRNMDSGLAFAPYRVYSASSARWLSRDPIEEIDDANLYRYCRNTPIVCKDPTGHFSAACSGLSYIVCSGGVGYAFRFGTWWVGAGVGILCDILFKTYCPDLPPGGCIDPSYYYYY